jgi:hypothetical protein
MGWHYILTFTCKLLPDYVDFIKNEYLRKCYPDEYDSNNDYKDTSKPFNKYTYLIDIWKSLDIGNYFYEYKLTDDIFHCKISKKVNRHSGDLMDAYKEFLHNIIVHITSEITFCTIESDDFGDFEYNYTDNELRNIPFKLTDKIKKVEHIYNEDKTEILESRVVYKYPIKASQKIDLDRCYGVNLN